jgi:hypothetical protein
MSQVMSTVPISRMEIPSVYPLFMGNSMLNQLFNFTSRIAFQMLCLPYKHMALDEALSKVVKASGPFPSVKRLSHAC